LSTEAKELISQAAYEAFQAIVGHERVSTDPVHMQAYKGRGYGREEDEFLGFCTRPACVILPKTTEEVVKIVKTCNRYGLPYLPVATMGMTVSTTRYRNDFVLLDMKLMDKLVIDEKNMYAIVEPGVLYAQLMEEAMKRDLYTLSAGGAQVSVLANHLIAGTGPLTYRVGFSDRRINAAEWVTPEGEVVRVGSNVVDDWFWQDGLGPNLMGLIRGDSGWMGALGVVTKLSVKLYPFQPQPLKPEGRTPHTYTLLPPRMKFQNYTMPSRKALDDAVEEIKKMEIGAMVERVPIFFRVVAKSPDRKQFWEAWQKVTKEEIEDTNILRVLLVGYTSQKQLEFEERVLMDIMKELGGEPRRTRQTDQSTFKYADSSGMWRMTGGYISSSLAIDGMRACIEVGKRLANKLMEYTPPLMTEHGDPGWHHTVDFGHSAYTEFLVYMDVDKIDPESPKYNKEDAVRVYQWYASQAPAIHVQTGFFCYFDRGVPFRMTAGPWHNFYVWMERVKQEFDALDLSNPVSFQKGSKMSEQYPEFITQELKDTLAKASRSEHRQR